MQGLPSTSNTPFVRTDFSNELVWREIVEAVGRESPDGFRAYISIIDDPGFSGARATDLAAGAKGHRLLLVADATTMSHGERPILCIDLTSDDSIRVIPRELWSIENNLSIANLDFEDFAESAGSDGIYRGFA